MIRMATLTLRLRQNMIADLKTDSARWEQDVSRRAEQGINRGSYNNPGLSPSQSPNNHSGTYIQSGIRDGHQQTGPPVYSAPPQYEPVYSQPPQHAPQYGSVQSNQGYMQYQHSPAYGHNTYPQSQSPYNPNQSQPPISSSDMHPSSYIHQGGPGYPPYTEGRPRYTGPGEEYEQEYIPVTSGMSYPTTAGMAYPPTTVPDMRMGDVRYPPDSYQEQVRAQPRERDSHRRQR